MTISFQLPDWILRPWNLSELSKERLLKLSEKGEQLPNANSFRVRLTTADGSIRDREAVNEKEERKDYPEVTPTAAKVFSCDRCGKEFQSPDDLFKHRHFESGSASTEFRPRLPWGWILPFLISRLKTMTHDLFFTIYIIYHTRLDHASGKWKAAGGVSWL